MSDLISRQAAIDSVQGIGQLATLPDNDAVIRMSAVEYVLYNLPSAQPELCEDANKLKRCRFEYINACKIVAHPTPDTSKNDIYDAYAVMKALYPIFGDEECEEPSAQPERKKGKWLPDNNNYIEERFICSVCGKSYKVDTCMGKPMWDFCPCGADMRGEKE